MRFSTASFRERHEKYQPTEINQSYTSCQPAPTSPVRCCTVAVRSPASSVTDSRFPMQFGSGAGIRTPNLAVNRRLRPVQKRRSEFAEYRYAPLNITVYRRRCCTRKRLLGTCTNAVKRQSLRPFPNHSAAPDPHQGRSGGRSANSGSGGGCPSPSSPSQRLPYWSGIAPHPK